MVSTFTPNIQLEEPARGDDVGTWDTPVNSNMTLIDLVTASQTNITLNNSPVVLSAAQFQSHLITLVSTLTGNVAITFPTSFTKTYLIRNACTGSSAFVVTLQTTAAGGQAIGAPPGDTIQCYNGGANLAYLNLERVGAYWDYAGSSVPAWVSACTVPPYLACTGGAVSSGIYPVLFGLIGATLPDSRGRTRMALDAGVGRVSSAVSGVAGNTLFGSGGDQLLHAHNHPINDPGHFHTFNVFNTTAGVGAGSATAGSLGAPNTAAAVTGVTVANSTQGGTAQNMPPVYAGGITMIRAA